MIYIRTIKPVELAAEIIQIGYLRGYLLADRKNIPHLDGQILHSSGLEKELENINIKRLRGSLYPHVKLKDRAGYIGKFMTKIKSKKSRLTNLYNKVEEIEKKYDLEHPAGIGLLAIHCFHEDRGDYR